MSDSYLENPKKGFSRSGGHGFQNGPKKKRAKSPFSASKFQENPHSQRVRLLGLNLLKQFSKSAHGTPQN